MLHLWNNIQALIASLSSVDNCSSSLKTETPTYSNFKRHTVTPWHHILFDAHCTVKFSNCCNPGATLALWKAAHLSKMHSRKPKTGQVHQVDNLQLNSKKKKKSKLVTTLTFDLFSYLKIAGRKPKYHKQHLCSQKEEKTWIHSVNEAKTQQRESVPRLRRGHS